MACGWLRLRGWGILASVMASGLAAEDRSAETRFLLKSDRKEAVLMEGQERRWSFVADEACLTSSSLFLKGGGLYYVITDLALHALDAASGKPVWNYQAAPVGFSNEIGNVLSDGKRLFLTFNTTGTKLTCLDITNGKMLWQFPRDEARFAWYDMALHEGLLVAKVIRDTDGKNGPYEIVALDRESGKETPLAGKPDLAWGASKDLRRAEVAFENQADFPTSAPAPPFDPKGWEIVELNGDDYKGLLAKGKREDLFSGVWAAGCRLKMPAFYRGPAFVFYPKSPILEKYLGKKVRIRGINVGGPEKHPPIYYVQVGAISAGDAGENKQP